MNAVTDTSATPAAPRRHIAAMIGGAFAIFAAGALATALVLDGPKKAAPAAEPVAAVANATPPAPKAGPKAEPRAKDNRPAATPLDTQHALATPACTTCGVIEAVTPIQKKGEGTGIGAVAGGVVGGVVGHQVGGGTGKQAMTVLGAIGGGLAGHEIEKRERSTTVYQLKIRMADGSTRSVTQGQPMGVGQHVQVDGQHVTPVADDGAAAPGGVRAHDAAART